MAEPPAARQRPNVLIGTPCYGGQVTHVYVHSLLKLMAYAAAYDIGLGLWTAAYDSLVPRARNTIMATFLDAREATHLMFIDADTGFSALDFQRLLSFDQDIVAGMYPVKNIDWTKAAGAVAPALSPERMREAGLHYVGVACAPGEGREERDGFVTGVYAGTGFMLIRRSAAERLVAAYPETKYRAQHTYPGPHPAPAPSDNHYNLFDCMIDPETQTYLSEDYAFCRRWRAIGGQIWLDTMSRLRHVGPYEFQGSAATALGG